MNWLWIIGGVVAMLVLAALIEAFVKRGRYRRLSDLAENGSSGAKTTFGMEAIDMAEVDRTIAKHTSKQNKD